MFDQMTKRAQGNQTYQFLNQGYIVVAPNFVTLNCPVVSLIFPRLSADLTLMVSFLVLVFAESIPLCWFHPGS